MKKIIDSRFIGDFAGVTSRSTRRAGSLRDTAHYPKIGFTLAEVLITLGIIGVVAAMTLPALINKYEKKVTVTKLQRAYSLINQAFKMAETKNGEVSEWPDWDNAEKVLKDYIAPTMKVRKFYSPNSTSSRSMCYEEKDAANFPYKWTDKATISSPFWTAKTASISLVDGICIGLNPKSESVPDEGFSDNWGANVFVDINGSKGPNMAGYDLFFFVIVGNSVRPYGYNLSASVVSSESYGNACNLKAARGGYMCASRIINDGWEIKYR